MIRGGRTHRFDSWSERRALWALIALSFCLLLAIVAIIASGFKLELALGNDAPNIVERSLRLYRAGEVSSLDPPLRYVPWALAYHVLGTGAPATVAYATTVLIGLPVLAGSVLLFARELGTLQTGVYALLAFLLGFGLYLLRLPWADDWMYITPLPWVMLTLYFTHRGVRSGGYRFAVAAGVAAAVVGLQQIFYGGLVVAIVAVSFALARRWRALLVALASGAPAVPVLVSYLLRRPSITSSKLALVDPFKLVYGIPTVFQIEGGMDSPTALFVAVAAVLLWQTRATWRTPVLTGSLAVLLPTFFATRLVFVTGWATSITSFALQLVLAVGLVLAFEDRLPSLTDPRHYASALVVVLTSSLTLLHWLVNGG